MKKILIVTTILLLAFLSACGSASTGSAPAATNEATTVAPANATGSTTSSVLSTDYTDAASLEQQLLLGSLQLEGSDNAISADQASQLLTLWSSLNSFGPGRGNGGGPQQPGNGDAQSTPQAPVTDATATVDTDSVLAQIQAVMTSAQLQAIAGMQLTNASVTTYISDNNLSLQPGNGGGQQGNPPSDGNGTAQPQGTPPADGGNGQGAQPDGTMQAPANGQQPDRSTNVLLNAVIQLLQQKTGTPANGGNAPAQ